MQTWLPLRMDMASTLFSWLPLQWTYMVMIHARSSCQRYRKTTHSMSVARHWQHRCTRLSASFNLKLSHRWLAVIRFGRWTTVVCSKLSTIRRVRLPLMVRNIRCVHATSQLSTQRIQNSLLRLNRHLSIVFISRLQAVRSCAAIFVLCSVMAVCITSSTIISFIMPLSHSRKRANWKRLRLVQVWSWRVRNCFIRLVWRFALPSRQTMKCKQKKNVKMLSTSSSSYGVDLIVRSSTRQRWLLSNATSLLKRKLIMRRRATTLVCATMRRLPIWF